MNQFFRGLFDTEMTRVISVEKFLLCVFCSLVIGILLALAYTYKSKYSQSFLFTLSLIPTIVCVVIMMVNGSIGAGVAVAGAFSLVRFRSAQGSAKEICAIFIAMAEGLLTGMGYLGYGLLFAIVTGGVMFLYAVLGFGLKRSTEAERTLMITIPENLNYQDVFKDVFDNYTIETEMESVKTANMGSLFKLTYFVTLKDVALEKEFIDKLRCRNGNLEIYLAKREVDMQML